MKGDAEEVEDKELVAQASAKLYEYGIRAKPKKAWVLSVNEVYSLKPESKSKVPMISAYG